MPSYQIDVFDFISFEFPRRKVQRTQVDARPGVDGHGIWWTGSRGQQFDVITFRDCLDLGDAITTLNNYQSIIGSNVSVVWSDYIFPNRFDVLGVQSVRMRSTILGVGGQLGFSNALLVARWRLVESQNPFGG